jgi:hypothetical protein
VRVFRIHKPNTATMRNYIIDYWLVSSIVVDSVVLVVVVIDIGEIQIL